MNKPQLSKCPETGLMGYDFEVTCQCYCHQPGPHVDWIANPCCRCKHYNSGAPAETTTVFLYPHTADMSEDVLKKITVLNTKTFCRNKQLAGLESEFLNYQ